jgi:hypothetical protein
MAAACKLQTFSSLATNLVRGDTNNADDVFVRDLRTGTTKRVSVGRRGAQGNDRSTFSFFGATRTITRDGRYVAFWSAADNLVPVDTNAVADVFVRDLLKGVTTRVSVSSAGTQGNGAPSTRPAISGDGRIVVFFSAASDFVPGDTNGVGDIFVHTR